MADIDSAIQSSKSRVIEDDDGTGFDPTGFMNQIFSIIDSNRSNAGVNYNILSDSPVESGVGNSAGESHLNAFYRMLGLPAVRDEGKIGNLNQDRFSTKKEVNIALSQGFTLNYFRTNSQAQTFKPITDAIIERNNIFNIKTTPDILNTMIISPIDISESVKEKPLRRASLFPTVVDAAIPVFPISRRTAPAFFNGDFITSGGTRLSRPFIEHIIYMRVKGGQETKLKDDLIKNIETEITDPDIRSQLIGQINNLGLIEIKIVSKLIQTIKKSAVEYKNTITQLKQLSNEVSFFATPSDNPNQRSIVPVPGQPGTSAKSRKLSAQIDSLNTLINQQDIFILSLPTEAITRSDRIRRIEDDIRITNIKNDVFVSEFAGLITFERADAERRLEQVLAQQSEVINRLEKARRDIVFYTGETTNLSIFDVICVFYALFTLDLKFLINLLNPDAKERLISDPFFSPTEQNGDSAEIAKQIEDIAENSNVSLTDSLAAFKKQIILGFDIAQNIISNK